MPTFDQLVTQFSTHPIASFLALIGLGMVAKITEGFQRRRANKRSSERPPKDEP